jgi:hypothetical protein
VFRAEHLVGGSDVHLALSSLPSICTIWKGPKRGFHQLATNDNE